DDNAAFRQNFEQFADPTTADPLEARAKAKHLNYVKLEGEVGIIGNGAGLVMSTLDVVAYAGEAFGGARPANFRRSGGAPRGEGVGGGGGGGARGQRREGSGCGGASWPGAVLTAGGAPPPRGRRSRRGPSRGPAGGRGAGSRSATRSWCGWMATTPPRAGPYS